MSKPPRRKGTWRHRRRIDRALGENFHYRYARRLGQLGPLRAFAARKAEASYLAACMARGQRAGDVKYVALDRRDGWTPQFEGRFADPPPTV
jgi:GH3 auxin-responsive promoter.